MRFERGRIGRVVACVVLGLVALSSCEFPGDKAARVASDARYRAAIDAAKAEEAAKKAEKKKRRETYVAEHPDLSPKTREDILEGLFRLGMTANQVRASWGEPETVSRLVSTFGVVETWKYYDLSLTFDDGVLTSWYDPDR